ncbi:MAG TPA: histidine kinase [Bryobacteraceae bacterium]|nr:histidine kinase [Bryobacteraceae bacterium]
MLESIHTQEPLLINTIGHSVGLLLFAGLLLLLIRDGRKAPGAKRYLPAVAALVALGWNAGSLVVLAYSSSFPRFADVVAAVSFGVLSLLPALLLHLSLEGRNQPIWICGYFLSGTAMLLHLAELFGSGERLHWAALWIIIAGFGPLTLIAMWAARRETTPSRRTGPRILAGMCLFLLAISFVHFRPGRMSAAWKGELALHHAGIPLALYVLLQDYRFLLADAFVRFLASGVVAAGIMLLGILLNARFAILERAARNPFWEGISIVGGGLVLVGLVWVRGRLQLLLTRVVFRRSDREPALRQIRQAGSKAESESAFLEKAAAILAAFMRTPEHQVLPMAANALEAMSLTEPAPVVQPPALRTRHEVWVPVRFAKGDGAVILLGRREGGRRYLSEDFQELGRMAAVIVEQVERLRNSEIQRLVSQAELRALQSQINPHFLFNSLNTLYGTIPREASEARRMVLNLAEIFRYCLKPERNLIPLADEVQIIRAYLEIEKLRLGDKLRATIDVDRNAEQILIPILSVQPLIENAVKHGVAARGEGAVALRARARPGGVAIEVSDDGCGFAAAKAGASGGVGLDNVRQRLRLCFGEDTRLEIESNPGGTKVSFLIPGVAQAIPA